MSKLKTAQGPLIKALELLSDSYIELAYHDAKKQISKKQNTPHLPLPPASGLLKYKPSHAVAMPTLTIPIDPACRYDNIVCIVEFDSSYRVEGGINMPKVLSCLGSDGIQRRQLLKVGIMNLIQICLNHNYFHGLRVEMTLDKMQLCNKCLYWLISF